MFKTRNIAQYSGFIYLKLNSFPPQVEESREENLFGFLVTLLDTGVTLEFHVEDPHDSEKWVHDLKFTTSIYRKRRKPEFLPVSFPIIYILG